MNRLILYTTIGLFALSWTLNLAFAEKTNIVWGDIRLQSTDVQVQFENASPSPWAGGTLAVKIFQDQQLLEHGSYRLTKPIAPAQKEKITILLKKSLMQGRSYRVEAHLQQGRAPVTSWTWKEVAVFDMPASGIDRSARMTGQIGRITEPHQLRKSIQAIDLKKAITVF